MRIEKRQKINPALENEGKKEKRKRKKKGKKKRKRERKMSRRGWYLSVAAVLEEKIEGSKRRKSFLHKNEMCPFIFYMVLMEIMHTLPKGY